MLQVHAFTTDTEKLPQPTLWSENRHGNRLDCETAALLRQVVAPVFASATSWQGLRRNLRAEGYDFVFDGGRLILVETLRGTKICSCRFLGHPLAGLVARFGKLRVRPPRAQSCFGQAVLED
jgi:hypothetical protein